MFPLVARDRTRFVLDEGRGRGLGSITPEETARGPTTGEERPSEDRFVGSRSIARMRGMNVGFPVGSSRTPTTS